MIICITCSVVLRSMCGVLGIWVTQDGAENRKKTAKVLITNYTSTLDHLAVDLVIPNIMVSIVMGTLSIRPKVSCL